MDRPPAGMDTLSEVELEELARSVEAVANAHPQVNGSSTKRAPVWNQ